MDDANRRILRVIQKKPELTMRELAEETGLSHTPCWRRLNRLREEGIIAERKYILDPRAVGYEFVAFCFVRMKEHARQTLVEFEKAVQKIPEILECYSATGDFDYILKVVARDVPHYEHIVKTALVELPRVSFINTSLTLGEVKKTTEIPI